MTASLPPRDNLAIQDSLSRAREALERFGVLLLSDPALPSLVGIIVGEPLRSSWWGHPSSHIIYQALNRLDDDPDVLSIKLVAGKVTFVDRRLWPAVYVLATARDDWQMVGLTPGAHWLLGETDAQGTLPSDAVVVPPTFGHGRRVADFARELERRLLVHATEIHTPSGAHAKILQTWQLWAARVGLPNSSMSASQARQELEEAAARLAAGVPRDEVQLPWQPRPTRRRGSG
jgi:hypothetical protein